MLMYLPLKKPYKTSIMKTFLLPVLLLIFGLNTLKAQEQKSQIKKNIEVEDVNGEVTVTVNETNGSTETINVYTGEEAAEFLENNSNGNSFFFTEGDDEKVIVVEMDGDEGGEYLWIAENDFDIDIDMDELTEQLEGLKDELDELSKSEIESRINEMLELQEEMKNVQVIALKEIHENIDIDEIMDELEDIDVKVEEVDGNIIITRTEGGNTTVEEINIGEDNNRKKIIVKSSVNSKKDASAIASSSSFDVNVYPNPNNGSFTIELNLNNEEPATVKVVDASGKVVFKKNVKGKENHSLKVDLKKPSAGVYVVVIEQQNEIVKLKTIIE